jgi:hypothetical protein
MLWSVQPRGSMLHNIYRERSRLQWTLLQEAAKSTVIYNNVQHSEDRGYWGALNSCEQDRLNSCVKT